MNWITAIARPEIRNLHAYEHAAWEPGLIRLHANESPWRSPGDTSQEGLNRYPEPHPLELSAALAQLYSVAAASVLACRGSDEAIDLLIRSYCRAGHDAIVICPPTFGMYGVTAGIQGAAVLRVPLLREEGYRLDPDAVLKQCDERVRLVFLCSPNNPTGTRLDTAGVLEIARALEGRALTVVDEAYIEFADQASLAGHLAEYPGLVVLRTLSKAYGLAGARCGALIAHADIVALLRRVIQPYAVTQLSIEAVFRALQPPALVQTAGRIATLKRERQRVGQALTAIAGITRVWPSQANFLLTEFSDPANALARAHAAGLLVRDMRGGFGLTHALRISLGSPEQNDRLLASLA
jgi:histidinol-phosphate aminotransferase